MINFYGAQDGQKIFFACQVILVSAKVSSRSEVEQVYYQDSDIKLFHKKAMTIRIYLRELLIKLCWLILVALGLGLLGALMALEEYVLWH